MYIVKCYHQSEDWYRGDLTSKNVIEDVKIFKKRETAKDFIENKLRYKSDCWRRYAKKGTSCCGYNTGRTWIEENTGETVNECYSFIMSKVEPI